MYRHDGYSKPLKLCQAPSHPAHGPPTTAQVMIAAHPAGIPRATHAATLSTPHNQPSTQHQPSINPASTQHQPSYQRTPLDILATEVWAHSPNVEFAAVAPSTASRASTAANSCSIASPINRTLRKRKKPLRVCLIGTPATA